MIVTTAGRTNETLISLAQDITNQLQATYVARQKQAVEELQAQLREDVLVIGKNRFVLYPYNRQANAPLFFHPNSAMFRVKRVLRGEDDPFIMAAHLQPGMSLLDCTLGLASDSIVASAVVGVEGQIVGIEGNRYLSFLVRSGLQAWGSGHQELDAAMRRIQVYQEDHLAFLKKQPAESFDIVYFDPMFEEQIEESEGIKGLRNLAVYSPLTEEIIAQALRVARQRVVLKDHWRSARFGQFGMEVYKRKTAKFHFGVLDKKRNDKN